jgi:pimeloyl-ACP methyl ester carboxylesterase
MAPLLWLAADLPAAVAARFAVVAPAPDPRWWALSSEPDLLALAADGRKWAVAGVGMGGQAAVRLGLRHPGRFPVAAAIDAAFDFHDLHGRGTPLDDLFPSRERARQDTAVLHLDPFRWPQLWFAADPAGPWHRGADRLHEKLAAYGVPHTADLDTTGPEYVAKQLPALVAFVAAATDREARRLA